MTMITKTTKINRVTRITTELFMFYSNCYQRNIEVEFYNTTFFGLQTLTLNYSISVIMLPVNSKRLPYLRQR